MSANSPRIPGDLRRSGKRLWISITSAYDLSDAELLLLHQAARLADICSDLASVIAREGVMNSQGFPHPAVKELRAQAQALAVVIKDLRIPAE